MKTIQQTIGTVAKKFASVVCLLSLVLAFAPSTQAYTPPTDLEKHFVSTDNEYETEYNPFVEPLTMPHWMSNLTRHTCWTNYIGDIANETNNCSGFYAHWQQGTWFIATNRHYTVNMPKDYGEYYTKVQTGFWNKKDGQGNFVGNENTCLARIQKAAEAKLSGGGLGTDATVGENVTVALCQLLRPHEAGPKGHDQASDGGPHCYVVSNTFESLHTDTRVWKDRSFVAGLRLDADSWMRGDKIFDFTYVKYSRNPEKQATQEDSSPTKVVELFNEHYGPGIHSCIATLDKVPADWTGTYTLHNRDYGRTEVKETVRYVAYDGTPKMVETTTNRTRTVTGPDAWPAFDEDVELDRGDVLIMKSICHLGDAAVQMLRAYKLPCEHIGTRADLAATNLVKVQEALHTIGYTDHSPFYSNRIDRVGYSDRIEHAIHDLYHLLPTFLESIDDSDALAAARTAYVNGLACFLDADAFIFGKAVSKTGKTIVGKRNLDQLHLIEFDESDDEGGEWNIAGWREFAEKTYASLTGKGTTAAVQTIDLADVGNMLDIHVGSQGNASDAQHGVIDFSGLGPNKDGKVPFDMNAFFDGKITRNAVILNGSAIATNGPACYVPTRRCTPDGQICYGEGTLKEMPFYRLVNRLHLALGPTTVSPTLCGLYPSGTLFSDLATMKAQFPASGAAKRSGFAQMTDIYTSQRKRIESGETLTIANDTYNGVITAASTSYAGGAFWVGEGAALTVTNVTFEGNRSGMFGGAIHNNGGTLSLKDVTFSGNSASQGGGAIANLGLLNLNGEVTLATASDTIANKSGTKYQGTLNWNLTDGNAGLLNGYQNIKNDSKGKLQITIDDEITAPTNIVIATGDFSNLARKDTFTITNTSSASSRATTINGVAAASADGWTGYKLETVEDLTAEPPTTNLVLNVFNYTAVHKELKTGESTNLVAGTTYTAAPTDEDGGVFYLEYGATLTGTNVTFESNSASAGGAILNSGVATLTKATFKDNVASSFGGAISNSGALNLNDVAFENNTAGSLGGAIVNEKTVNLLGPVSLATTNDTFVNIGLMNWDLTGETTGVLNGYENLINEFSEYTGTLQLTVDDDTIAASPITIATGDFTNLAGKDTFTITNTSSASSLAATINGGATAAGGYLYKLEIAEDLGATPPTTNLVLSVVKPDMSKVIVNSNWAGKYKLGDEVEIEGETYYYGLNAVDEIPHDGSLMGTETLEIAGGSAAITNAVALKKDESGNPIGKLVIDNGAALSIMGEGSITNSLAAANSISGSGAIYLDKGLTDGQLKDYTDKLAPGSAITVARASVDDKAVKDAAKVEEGGKTYYNVITSDQPASGETNNTVVTSAIVVDGAGDTDGLLLKTNDEKPLIVAGSVTTTVPDQSLKLVKEQAADLTVNGKISGFETIAVENKNAIGKMVATSTLAANKNIEISNDGHLEAKALAGGNIDINNTSANTIIGEYSGRFVAITNTAKGVAQDITLQAYGKDGSAGYIRLFGEAGGIYSNVTLVAGNNATPSDISANDGKGTIQVFDGIKTLSGTVLMRGGKVSGSGGGSLRFENADVTCSVPNVAVNTEISGECNIASNDLGTTTFTGNLTLNDGAVLGGKTRLASSCNNNKFVLEGTVTFDDGAELSRTSSWKDFDIPAGATLVTKGAKISCSSFHSYGEWVVEAGTNTLEFSNNCSLCGSSRLVLKKGAELFAEYFVQEGGRIDLAGGTLIGDLWGAGGIQNWDLAEGTTTLNWAQMKSIGTLMATVTNVAGGTSYLLATNVTSFASTFTVTNIAEQAAAQVGVGGVCRIGGQYWALSVLNGELRLAALDPVKLTDVFLIDKTTEPYKTNATAVVKFGDQTVSPNADGSFDVPANYPLDIVYEAAGYGTDDGNMFGPGWQYKTVTLPNGIAGNASLDDPEYADLKASVASQCQAQWVEATGGRTITVDTRTRIVVASPTEVLPLAYSTNNWGAAAGEPGFGGNEVQLIGKDAGVYTNFVENGYYDWMPKSGEYGVYDFVQQWSDDNGPCGSTNATIYYTTYFPLSWATPVGGTIAVTNAGVALSSPTNVLGYSLLNLAATPTMTAAERYEFTGWTAKTNNAAWPEAFTNAMALAQTLEMPNAPVELAANFQWKSNYAENVEVAAGETWPVLAGETYSNRFDIAAGGHAYGEGTLFTSNGAVNAKGTFAFTNVTFSGLNRSYLDVQSTGELVRCTFTQNKNNYAANSVGISGHSCCLILGEGNIFKDNVKGQAVINQGTVLLRGTNTFEGTCATFINYSSCKLIWDFTAGYRPCFVGYTNLTNNGKIMIQTVDDENDPADLANGVYTIATRVYDTAGRNAFTITNDYGSVACTIYEGSDPDEGWAYLGTKRYKLVVDKGALCLNVDWGKFAITYDAMGAYLPDGATTTNIDSYVNKGYDVAPNPVRTGYTFLGWYDGVTNGAPKATKGKKPLLYLAEHTLYAKWQSKSAITSALTWSADGSVKPSGNVGNNLVLPDTIGGKPVLAVGQAAFAGSKYKTSSITNFVSGCFLTDIRAGAFNVVTTLKKVTISEARDFNNPSVRVPVTIGKRAFAGTRIESLEIPADTIVGEMAFNNCSYLEEIAFFGDAKNSSLTAEAFASCAYNSKAKKLKIYMSDSFKANNQAFVTALKTTYGGGSNVVIEDLSGYSPATAVKIDGLDLSQPTDMTITLSAKARISNTLPYIDTSRVRVLYRESLADPEVEYKPTSIKFNADGTRTIHFTAPNGGTTGFMRVIVVK